MIIELNWEVFLAFYNYYYIYLSLFGQHWLCAIQAKVFCPLGVLIINVHVYLHNGAVRSCLFTDKRFRRVSSKSINYTIKKTLFSCYTLPFLAISLLIFSVDILFSINVYLSISQPFSTINKISLNLSIIFCVWQSRF